MTEIRIEVGKAEQIITQILRDDESLLLADANAVAANICRRLLTIRTNSPVDVYRIIPREPPYGANFATAVAIIDGRQCFLLNVRYAHSDQVPQRTEMTRMGR